MEKTEIILGLFLMFAAAKIAGEIFVRLKQPPVIGELLAGVVIGAHGLGLIQRSEVFVAIAELGVIVLLFSVGLETKMDELTEVGRPAVLVGLFGVAAPLVLGFLGLKILGFSNIPALFIGTAMVATSVGITARVLADMGLIQHRVSRIILGAAILDDILALMVFRSSFFWVFQCWLNTLDWQRLLVLFWPASFLRKPKRNLHFIIRSGRFTVFWCPSSL